MPTEIKCVNTMSHLVTFGKIEAYDSKCMVKTRTVIIDGIQIVGTTHTCGSAKILICPCCKKDVVGFIQILTKRAAPTSSNLYSYIPITGMP